MPAGDELQPPVGVRRPLDVAGAARPRRRGRLLRGRALVDASARGLAAPAADARGRPTWPALDDIEAAFADGRISAREGHQRISATVRSFVARPGVPASAMTLADLERDGRSPWPTSSHCVYPPEFGADESLARRRSATPSTAPEGWSRRGPEVAVGAGRRRGGRGRVSCCGGHVGLEPPDRRRRCWSPTRRPCSHSPATARSYAAVVSPGRARRGVPRRRPGRGDGAGPAAGRRAQPRESRTRDLMLCLDASASMDQDNVRVDPGAAPPRREPRGRPGRHGHVEQRGRPGLPPHRRLRVRRRRARARRGGVRRRGRGVLRGDRLGVRAPR